MLAPMRLFCLAIALFLASQPAWADHTDPRLDDLFARLRTAEDYQAEALTARIVSIWSEPQSDTVAVLYDRAEAALAAGDERVADELLGHVVSLAPSFAQGWVLRARTRLSDEDYDGALSALERAVTLEPRHFLALESLGQTFLTLGQDRAAYGAFQQALRLNPHMEGVRQNLRALAPKIEGQGI